MEKIVVLAGGSSSEKDVSVKSGLRVASALCSLGIKTALADPTEEIDLSRKHFFEDFNRLNVFFKKNQSPPPSFSEKPTEAVAVRNSSHTHFCEEYITESVLELCRRADAVFITLHGGNGENGKLQALFDCLGIKYFGSGHEGSACAMNKLLSKRIFESVGIPTPLSTVYKHGQKDAPTPPRYPCVVKPASEGSSVGVTLVKNPEELIAAVGVALKSCDTVLLETEIKGREITVGILNDTPLAVTEIIPKDGFYDYENKYTAGKTEEITPAKISPRVTEKALRLAKRTHTALGLSNYSRIDMIIENGTGRIYVLEANTIPGMTETSLLPLAAEYRGIGFAELCGKMAK